MPCKSLPSTDPLGSSIYNICRSYFDVILLTNVVHDSLTEVLLTHLNHIMPQYLFILIAGLLLRSLLVHGYGYIAYPLPINLENM